MQRVELADPIWRFSAGIRTASANMSTARQTANCIIVKPLPEWSGGSSVLCGWRFLDDIRDRYRP